MREIRACSFATTERISLSIRGERKNGMFLRVNLKNAIFRSLIKGEETDGRIIIYQADPFADAADETPTY